MSNTIGKEQLAAMYGVSRQTLIKWLKAFDIHLGNSKLIQPAQLAKVFEALGKP